MAITTQYASVEPTRAQIDALEGPVIVEFGSPGCGYCRAAQPLLAAALQKRPHVQHLKVEDGSGRPLGRSFRVKLWPTLVFLKAGVEEARLVRPNDPVEIEAAFAKIDSA